MELLGLKEELIKIINEEINSAESIGRTLKQNEGKLLYDQIKKFETDLDKYSSDLRRIMSKMKMKCVTIGNTSNGKSSVLNALLNTNVLPTGQGGTTTCFISVEGCDDDKGFIMNDGQELELNAIEQLVNEIRMIETIVRLFVTKSQRDLLNEYSEFWDCPGIDQSDEIDSLIKKYSQDADVLMMVIDGSSTMEISEKSLLKGLMNPNVRPCIYFIVNKWDQIDSEGMKSMREQHKKSIKECFVDQLKVYSNDEIEERIFFVSATNLSLEDGDGNDIERLRKRLKGDFERNYYQKKAEITNAGSKLFLWLRQPIKMEVEKSEELLKKCCAQTANEIIVSYSNHLMVAEEQEEHSSIYKALSFIYNGLLIPYRLFRGIFYWKDCSTKKIKDEKEIYEERIDNFKGKLTEIFLSNSCIELSRTQLKQYLDFDVLFNNCDEVDCFVNQKRMTVSHEQVRRHLYHNVDMIKSCINKYIEDQRKVVQLLSKLKEKTASRDQKIQQTQDFDASKEENTDKLK